MQRNPSTGYCNALFSSGFPKRPSKATVCSNEQIWAHDPHPPVTSVASRLQNLTPNLPVPTWKCPPPTSQSSSSPTTKSPAPKTPTAHFIYLKCRNFSKYKVLYKFYLLLFLLLILSRCSEHKVHILSFLTSESKTCWKKSTKPRDSASTTRHWCDSFTDLAVRG